MEVIFTKGAKDDIKYWKQIGNKTIMNRIILLITSIAQSPYEGIGKPEPLKYEMAGFWSRRITKEHRLVYRINNNKIEISGLRFHY